MEVVHGDAIRDNDELSSTIKRIRGKIEDLKKNRAEEERRKGEEEEARRREQEERESQQRKEDEAKTGRVASVEYQLLKLERVKDNYKKEAFDQHSADLERIERENSDIADQGKIPERAKRAHSLVDELRVLLGNLSKIKARYDKLNSEIGDESKIKKRQDAYQGNNQ